MHAQLGFCNGNSGDAIFTETFGTGTTDGPALAPGITTYNFTTATPNDGSYSISSTTNYFDWHRTTDHTPGDSNGKMLIVNADFTAGQFYQRTIVGLCENTSYEFSAFLLNFATTMSSCGSNLIPVNVKFQIWDDTDTNLLANGDTGNLISTATPTWTPYGLVFKTQPGQTSVILKMINNGQGGCGNDLAIDDIVFKSCGDFIDLTNSTGMSSMAICEDQGPVSITLTATPDFSIFNNHSYQWQESSDGNTWNDITGQTSNTYTTPLLNSSTFYRVKVAEDPINVSNSLCNVLSEVFDVLIVHIPDAPVSNGNITVCADALRPLTVSIPNSILVNWYDAPVNGNLLQENSTSFTPKTSGSYYAEASSSLTDCFSITRTELSYVINELPVVTDENLIFCENVPTMISAGISNIAYEWSTGETIETIEVVESGTYTVMVTDTNGCSAVKTIVLEQLDQPIIDTIVSDNENIIVTTVNSGEFEYAMDNGPFQNSPIFELVEGGLHIVNVRGKNNCPVVSQEFLHFVIPKFFTPNGDSFNDVFLLQGLEFFNTAEVSIFDRYGSLVKYSNTTSFTWDGTFNNRALPASDYWYLVKIDEMEFKGHFALKR